MNKRLKTIYKELYEKCATENCTEFEYYWEIYGVLWYPWTLEINGVYQSFSINDVGYKDLDALCDLGYIQWIKTYTKEEMQDEFDRKRYRILKATV